MQTNLFTNNASNTAASSATTNPLANGNETTQMFTKLLVAQIKNQDPLSPSDPSQFVSQLTQLSQTESMQSLSNLTSANASVLQSMQTLALGAQVGSNVTASATEVQLGTTPVQGQVTLSSSSSQTTLVLVGSDGHEHKVTLGSQAAGAVPFALDPTALGLPSDTYKMRVETSTKENPPLELVGRLNSVRLGSGGAVLLNVSNVGEIAPTAITAFNGKSTAVANSSASSSSF
ncbi:MAG: flagellar hook capping FlgD N-terminal domain-containing protein [Pseudomonadota bacterium]